ncbi:centrosomal protein of 68 kDa [Hyperolius riggenbachi]|uniref:centrosomal protein of 68 kDa n=1 Tax=Hyperolius riggenbachi TaxID=752182 RepID=UPI0035A2F726
MTENDLERDQLKPRSFMDHSWSYCGSSTTQPKYRAACKSLYSDFSQGAGYEKHSRNPQSLQEQYWACAIPSSPPPCPDRGSPSWDPNKEYQDLLDYTYPLNPKYCLDEDTETDGFLHDSGVDTGSYNLSCDSKIGSFGSPYQDNHGLKTHNFLHTNSLRSPYAFSTPLCNRPGYRSLRNLSDSSNVTSHGHLSPYAGKVGLVKESTTSFYGPKYNTFNKLLSVDVHGSSTESLQRSDHFLPTTAVLPLPKDLDTDEEYLSLPPNLKELEILATHLKELSLNVDREGSTNFDQVKACKRAWGLPVTDVDRGLCSSLKSKTTDGDVKDQSYFSELSSCQNHNGSERSRFPSLKDMLDGADSMLLGMNGCSSVQDNKSLVQRIQKFCQQLGKLIHWLYSVAEITDNWTAPKPDAESIQLSLSLYLKLKKDVAMQKTLADDIVKDGESLVKCMDVNSSVLKDTLELISKQSGELERHTERLYASVLEAMDTITDRGLGRNSNPKHPVPLEMKSS